MIARSSIRSWRIHTGYGLKNDDQHNTFTLPPAVSLQDGLSQDEAVMIALWNNAQLRATLAELGFARADLAAAGQLPNPVLSM